MPLSKSLGSLSKPLFQRKYIKLGRVYQYWTEIIGEKYATRAMPVGLKIRYGKSRTKEKKMEAVLTILTDSGTAMTLTYQKDLILARIEHIFGKKMIEDIKIIQGKVIRPDIIPSPAPPLPYADQQKLNTMLDQVDDPVLHARLEEFATSLYQSSKPEVNAEKDN